MPERSIETGREANTGRDTGVSVEEPARNMQGRLRAVSGRSIIDKETTPVTPNTPNIKPLTASDKTLRDFLGLPPLTQDSGVESAVAQPKSFGNNPLGILADLFASSYGRAPVESPQAPIVVGDASAGSGGGSNAGLLVLLAIVAIVGYFIYKRMKQ